ncbi:unnamed protein product [Acanthoscelides obtectus]|uniref:Major facilitator superfamily (MFS) profile domain-containing protein n=1 Tax=Acanthoscelides obtectus TaxID=200917 RepID=A0A9P0KSX7_ACAOB|nr:unnamed protein product [Acanthoscelides obtectus]CAK1660745.1 Facilitated trehalose transporter Tret1-2 homolog [Acanthoscelides obtectus]
MKSDVQNTLHLWLGRIWKTDQNEERSRKVTSPFLKQSLLALGPFLLTVGLGMTSGYSAILLPQLEHEQHEFNSTITIDAEQASWIASMAALPMAIGSMLGGVLLEKFGRRGTHLLTCFPTAQGWLLIYVAVNTKMILVGRFLTGFCAGILGTATGVYLGETAEPKHRGFFLAGISFAISFGLFLVHLLGTYLHWQMTALLSALISLTSFMLLLFVPESPSWLAKKNRQEKAKHAFHWCRGYSDDAVKELNIMLQRQEAEKDIKISFKELAVPEFWKPLVIIIVYIVANQWVGVNAITFYTVAIMKDTIGDGLDEYLAMLLVDAVRVIMSVIACILLRNCTRRSLALISGVGTFVSLFTLSFFTFFSKMYPEFSLNWVPVLCLFLYIATISIGFVPLPWALIGELFPLKFRSTGSSICSFMAFTAFFSVVKTSPGMFRSIGSSGTFLVYGIVALLGTIFVALFLPETRGKPLHEIEDGFKTKKKSNLILQKL